MSRKPRSNIRSQSHRHEAGTASVGADGGLAEPGTDAGLESAVAGALGRDGQLDANGIVVTASQGSVSLSGPCSPKRSACARRIAQGPCPASTWWKTGSRCLETKKRMPVSGIRKRERAHDLSGQSRGPPVLVMLDGAIGSLAGKVSRSASSSSSSSSSRLAFSFSSSSGSSAKVSSPSR